MYRENIEINQAYTTCSGGNSINNETAMNLTFNMWLLIRIPQRSNVAKEYDLM